MVSISGKKFSINNEFNRSACKLQLNLQSILSSIDNCFKYFEEAYKNKGIIRKILNAFANNYEKSEQEIMSFLFNPIKTFGKSFKAFEITYINKINVLMEKVNQENIAFLLRQIPQRDCSSPESTTYESSQIKIFESSELFS